ncbi:MAG TPA: tetratricopeptide repeat protein, partial [Blastocatellia bacterium]|nr:tetratricopeptide repeat protein [Blastocatellia bacterium]
YKVAVRKAGFISANKSFQTGSDTPTLVFKLRADLDDQVKQFDALVVSGKLIGPGTPNAFDFVRELASKYPDRPEVAHAGSVLVQKLTQSAQTVANETEQWRAVKRKRMEQGHEAAAAAASLASDNKDAVRLESYLSASVALRDWETGTPETADDKLLGTASMGFDKTTSLDPKWGFAWYQLGRCRLLSNDWDGARAAFSKSLEINGGLIDAHLGIAAAYYGQGDYKDSIVEYQKIISFDHNNYTAYAGMGIARAASGKTKDGLKDAERASQLKPESGIPHLSLGIIYSKSKKRKERDTAVAELNTAIEKNSAGLEFPNRTARALISELEGDKATK